MDKTNEEKLFEYCSNRLTEKDPFIKKAIGWALRQYSKTNMESVIGFLEENKNLLQIVSFNVNEVIPNAGEDEL